MTNLPVSELKKLLCWAGRWAFLSGKWDAIEPCPMPPIHVIGAAVGEEIHLCDEHFNDAVNAGYVTEPFIDPEEYERRRRRGQSR